MREINLRIDRNADGKTFDVLIKSAGTEELLEGLTGERVHNLVRSELNRALQSVA